MVNLFNIKKKNEHKEINILGIKFKLRQKPSIKNLKSFTKIIGAELPSNIKLNPSFRRVITQSPYVKEGDFVIDAGWYESEKVITESLERGAAAIFCDFETKKKFPQDIVIPIENPKEAIRVFENYCTKKCKAKRIAITGSVGKTTTTGLINSIVKNSFVAFTHDPMSNSHGAVLRHSQAIQPFHKYWVQEIGGHAPGYIEDTARFFKPDIVVLTNISDSHLNLYKTKENIFHDKSSLERCAKKNGTVIINYDDDILRNGKYSHKVITVSLKDSSADYYAKGIIMNNKGLSFTAVCRGKEINKYSFKPIR